MTVSDTSDALYPTTVDTTLLPFAVLVLPFTTLARPLLLPDKSVDKLLDVASRCTGASTAPAACLTVEPDLRSQYSVGVEFSDIKSPTEKTRHNYQHTLTEQTCIATPQQR